MKKYTRIQKFICALVILLTSFGSLFAREVEGNAADLPELDIRTYLLFNTNYQIDFADIERLQNTALYDGFALNNWQFAFAFQMTFGVHNDVALGFELGISSSIPTAIVIAFPDGRSDSNTILTLQILPRFVVDLFYKEQVSWSFLFGPRFDIDYAAREDRLMVNFFVPGQTTLTTLRFAFDFETRVNFALSNEFAFYIGLNYVLPFEVFAGEQNRFTTFDPNNPAVGFPGVLTPSLGMRLSL